MAQALIDRGAPSVSVSHEQGIALWAGGTLVSTDVVSLARTATGAPLGVLSDPSDTRRLVLPSRMRRADLR